MALLLLFGALVVVAVPGTALLVQAWFFRGDWRVLNPAVYFGAWAFVAFAEILLAILSGEFLMALIVPGFWSTIGAVAIGGLWWLASRPSAERAESEVADAPRRIGGSL